MLPPQCVPPPLMVLGAGLASDPHPASPVVPSHTPRLFTSYVGRWVRGGRGLLRVNTNVAAAEGGLMHRVSISALT